MKMRNCLRRCALCAALLACILLLCGCNAQELSSLRSFSAPYVGVYECTYAKFGRHDVFEDYREITLTLEESGAFTVSAVKKSGKEEKARGKYEYDEESSILCFFLQIGSKIWRRGCAVHNGRFVLSDTFAGKTLVMKFEVKA